MVVLPLLQGPLGLTDTELGIWAGASVHEVGQVVAAAGPAGATAVAVAVVVKLTRVLLLAPVVATVGLLRRRSGHRDDGSRSARPPLVPLFVVGFLAVTALRSTGLLPASVLDVVAQVQAVALAAALFGMGTGVRVAALVRGSGGALAVSVVSTVVIAAVSLAGVLVPV